MNLKKILLSIIFILLQSLYAKKDKIPNAVVRIVQDEYNALPVEHRAEDDEIDPDGDFNDRMNRAAQRAYDDCCQEEENFSSFDDDDDSEY